MISPFLQQKLNTPFFFGKQEPPLAFTSFLSEVSEKQFTNDGGLKPFVSQQRFLFSVYIY